MAWETPRTWQDNELVTASLMNAQLRDNLTHLYEALPNRAMLWHLNSVVINGNGLNMEFDASQYFSHHVRQSPSADGDSFSHAFILSAGTYTLHILGESGVTRGRIDWALDGQTLVTAQDWYQGLNNNNIIKTISNVVIDTSGRHVLTGTVNGKNGSSTNYNIILTAMWFEPASDS